MRKDLLEVKVGLFFIISCIILVAGLVFFSHKKETMPTYQCRVLFGYVGGLLKGAPVCYAGVDIGQVKDIAILTDECQIAITLDIKENIALRKDVTVTINTMGVMGEKYIEIMGGSKSAPFLSESFFTIQGKDPISMEKFTSEAEKMVREVKSVCLGLKGYLSNPQVKEDVTSLIAQAHLLVNDILVFMQHVNATLEQNKDNVNLVFKRFSSSASKLEANMNYMSDILNHIEKGEGFLGQVLYNDSLYKNMEGLVDDIRNQPWKLFFKGSSKKKDILKKTDHKEGAKVSVANRKKLLNRSRNIAHF